MPAGDGFGPQKERIFASITRINVEDRFPIVDGAFEKHA